LRCAVITDDEFLKAIALRLSKLCAFAPKANAAKSDMIIIFFIVNYA
jgi:hypothetical protein